MTLTDSILALVVSALWGFNFVAIDMGLQSFPPFLFSVLRFFLAAFPAIFFFPRGSIPWKVIISVGVVLGSIKYSLLFVGMKVGMPAGLASLILQAQVVFTMVLSTLFLGDRPSSAQRLGMLVSVAGICLIAGGQQGGFTAIGFICTIGAAFAWATANIIIKKAAVDNYRLMIWMSIVPPIPMLCMSGIFETSQFHVATQLLTIKGLSAVVYTSLLATVVAFGIWGNLLRKYSANVVAPFALLVPVFGMLSAFLILGERPTPLNCAAMILIMLGLVMVTRKGYMKQGAALQAAPKV